MYELLLKLPGESKWRLLNGLTDGELACKTAERLSFMREDGCELKVVNTAEDIVKGAPS